jgi:hypothetical protein
LHVTSLEYFSAKRVGEWKENQKHEERKRLEGHLEQQRKERKTRKERRKTPKPSPNLV